MREMSHDRKYAPATVRNRDFILDVLRDVLPTRGVILEVACGSGEHVVHFARNLPSLVFQPSDPDPDARLSVAAWVKATGVTNLRAPIALDALHSVWPIASADGIICINMIHILPWQATVGLIKGAAAILPSRSPLYLYGPCKREGSKRRRAIKPSTRAFASRPELGSARPRSGRGDGAIRWVLGSGYPRSARKQSERGVPPNVIVSVAGDPPATLAFRDRPILAAGLVDLNRACRSRVIATTSLAAQCWFRLTLFEPVAFPTLRRPIYLTAVELLADRSASPRLESDAVPSALEMG
jgi:Protein of unknown function (DUF938)